MQWPVNAMVRYSNKHILTLSYRWSNIVASRYYVLRYSKKRVTAWSTYVSECHVY